MVSDAPKSFLSAVMAGKRGDKTAMRRFLAHEEGEFQDQMARQIVRHHTLDAHIRGLMARRSPEPEPGAWLTESPAGHLIVSTAHPRGELLVIVPPPWLGCEHIRYRPDREGG